ncbi:MAG TPA: alpha/beta hydrolase [Phytomonospora sp.]
MRTFTVEHDGVALHVTRGGSGPLLVLCPGLSVSQVDLDGLISLLRKDFEVVAFDLRGHGRSSAGEYSFEGFLADLRAVMAGLPSPILVGYSLGADLAVHYAASAPVASLVLIDGGNPLPEAFITGEYVEEFREIFAGVTGPLTPEDVLRVNLEIDAVRLGILERYEAIDAPIRVVTSTWIAGEDGPARHNELWRAGWARLAEARPEIPMTRLATDHGLVFSHPEEVAAAVRAA